MSSLRIVFVLPVADTSGGVRVVATYAQRLAARGHDVQVVSGSRSSGLKDRLRNLKNGNGFAKYWAPKVTHIEGVPHTVLPKESGVTDADVPDADIVVATWWATASSVLALTPEKGAKFYLIQHDERELCDAGDAVADTWRLPLNKVVIAGWLKPLLRGAGVNGPIEVIPNAVDTKQFFAPPREKQSQPTVGLMYLDHRSKGYDIALEAVKIARQSLPDLRVLAFGRDKGVPGYPGLPLPENAVYTQMPALKKIREIYASCDVWLQPSRSEGFGLPILEAMACRTPVIGTPAGAASDVLPDNAGEGGAGHGGGFLVPAEDPTAMAEAIVRVAKLDNAGWRDLSDRALRTVTDYTWESATDKLEASMQRAVTTESLDVS